MDRPFKILIAIGLAALFLVLLTSRLVNYSKLQKVDGTVISIGKADLTSMYRKTNENANHQFPVISYQVEGKELFYIKQSEVLFEKFNVGEKVSLLYQSKNPSNVYMNSLFGFWITVPSLIIFLLLGILWVGFLYVIFDSRKKPKTNFSG